MKLIFDSITPGISILPFRKLRRVSNTVHSCAWRGFAASSEIAEGRAREHDVDDVGERHVAVMRALVVAPAQVHAQLLRRDVRERVVQRLDVQLRLAGGTRRAIRFAYWMCRPMREVGAVDLQHDAGACAIASYSWRIASAIANRYASSLG